MIDIFTSHIRKLKRSQLQTFTTYRGDERRQIPPANFQPQIDATSKHLLDVVIETVSSFNKKVTQLNSNIMQLTAQPVEGANMTLL